MLQVGQLISLAFMNAIQRERATIEPAIQASFRIGSKLPDSMLGMSIQRISRLDATLRCLEDDFQPHSSWPSEQAAIDRQVMLHEQHGMLSELWIGAAYEVVRVIKDRKLVNQTKDFLDLAHDLRLVRVTLEKYEIAGDNKLKVPLEFVPVPAKDGDSPRVYDKADPRKAHRMPVGLSARGSISWLATYGATRTSRWIERRDLSDRLLALYRREIEAPSLPACEPPPTTP